MSVYSFFRSLFGFPDRPQNFQRPDDPGLIDEFRNPIWGSDEEDSDDEFRHGGASSHFGFNVLTDPLEMHRFFEQQMNEMLKSFQHWNMPDIFGLPNVPAIEYPEERKSTNLRDQVLKPGYTQAKTQHDEKVDTDLDAKVRKSGIGSLIKEGEAPYVQITPKNPSYGGFTSKSIIRRSSRRPDGSVEQEEIVRDSAGNEKRTVTRTIGDQSHIIITESGPDGTKCTDQFVNIDEDKLNNFEERWNKSEQPQDSSRPRSEKKSILDTFSVEDLFKQEKSDSKQFKTILDDFSFDKFFK